MKLKSYFSRTVESAMELARQELGEEALLVHARPTTPETRYLGAYEVVFGVVPASPAPSSLAPNAPESSPLHGELNDLRRQIVRLTPSFE
jgi:flagellar biosynthesis GTPase FlhF